MNSLLKTAILLLFFSSGLYSSPHEFNIAKGENCFILFQEDGKADSITPFKQYSYTNSSFGEKETCITINFNKDNEELRLFVQLRKKNVPEVGGLSRVAFQVSTDKPILSKSALIDQYSVLRSEGLTEIKQIVVDQTTNRKYSVSILISANAENIKKRIAIPQKYIFFKWDFKDPFDSFEPVKEYFLQFE